MDLKTNLEILRVVQEAIHNAINRAKCTNLHFITNTNSTGYITFQILNFGGKTFSEKNLAQMKARENRTNVKNPDIIKDNLEKDKVVLGGEKLYQINCRVCHQQNGQGDGIRFPTIAKTDWVNGNKDTLIGVLLKGLEGPIKINGEPFVGMMPKFSQLPDQDIASILSYIRRNFDNHSDSVTKTEVAVVRQRLRLIKIKQMQLQNISETK